MNKEKYEELLLRFALELKETGVTDNMVELVRAQVDRTPNIINASAEETTDKFVYHHAGYKIEACRTVRLTVKKCKQGT